MVRKPRNQDSSPGHLALELDSKEEMYFHVGRVPSRHPMASGAQSLLHLSWELHSKTKSSRSLFFFVGYRGYRGYVTCSIPLSPEGCRGQGSHLSRTSSGNCPRAVNVIISEPHLTYPKLESSAARDSWIASGKGCTI